MAIFFHDEKIISNLKRKKALKTWMGAILQEEGYTTGEINVILTSDLNLLKINMEYLSRDYYTDIITFDNSEDKKIGGDLYISYERIIENALNYKEDPERELWRVIVHGLLHLIGYEDSNEDEIELMRNKENYYLDLIPLPK